MKTCPNGQELNFVLNNQVVELDVSADKTVLEAIRELGYTGTKEGCASGDCGACTVMVGELVEGKVKYHTINACIAPIGQQAGRQIITVEGLECDGELHPAQSQMVTCHGSQCGFCTPGFVMSLAAMVEQGMTANREAVLQGISGNLCRCTGYRPIIEAGLAALEETPVHKIPGWDLLNDMSEPDMSETKVFDPKASGSRNAVLQPSTEKELQDTMLEHQGARLIAGGTDLMLEVTQRYESMPVLIDVTRVQSLNNIEETSDAVVIGASVTYTALESFLPDRFSNKAEPTIGLLHRLGSRQIRNSGTLGGNLANGSPIADTPPILIAWDATLELVDTSGKSEQVPVEDFYRGYRDTALSDNQYIARIHIPLASIDQFHRFYKSSKRLEDDISSVMGAFRFTGESNRLSDVRVSFGGMAATPVRLKPVEALLVSRGLDDQLVRDALDLQSSLMTPMTDVRASADYRSDMAASMLERALSEFRGEAQPVITEVPLHA